MRSTDIDGVRFSTVRFQEGYAMDEVDDMLDRIKVAFASWEAGVPAQVRSDDFGDGSGSLGTETLSPVRFRTSYSVDEVDDFLDRVQEQLRVYEQGGRIT